MDNSFWTFFASVIWAFAIGLFLGTYLERAGTNTVFPQEGALVCDDFEVHQLRDRIRVTFKPKEWE